MVPLDRRSSWRMQKGQAKKGKASIFQIFLLWSGFLPCAQWMASPTTKPTNPVQVEEREARRGCKFVL